MTFLAFSLALIAMPASAANESANQESAASQGATAAKEQERKYCFKLDDIVGSRIRGKLECKTKAQWAREGVDVDRPSKS